MYIMYVDESGDTGLVNSPTSYFALTGMVVHESRWRDLLNALVNFRKTMKNVHHLPMRKEIHASEYVRSPPVSGMPKHVRLSILRNLLDELGKLSYLSVTSVIVNKTNKTVGYDVFDAAWKTLFQRFENTMQHGNLPGSYASDNGILIVDNTDGQKLQRLVRKMAVINYIPSQYGGSSRNIPIIRVIEDPHNKNSADSYFIQSCDVCAYFLQQKYNPNKYIKSKSAHKYFDRLLPILNVRATGRNPFGIVEL